MRIGFLLNHDQTHQAAHSVPVAAALARLRPDVEVVVATTNDRMDAEARELARRLGTTLRHRRLRVDNKAKAHGLRWLDRVMPATRLAIYGANLAFFRELDALVVTEKTSLRLKDRHGLTALPMIHTRHGAGDRAIGFNRRSAAFDHVLVPGPKVRDRLVAEAGMSPGRISMVGYPKFDLPPAPVPPFGFAHPERPTVLYNPHPSPRLSSWFRHGREVLDFFARSDQYNLVFAPHVMLFHRRLAVSLEPPAIARVGGIPAHVRAARNIHIDLGSAASTNMTYSDNADIYLGDVSSQVYEFLRRPRPCVFLNSHGVDAADDPNFAAWRAGPVIDGPAGLGRALAAARSDHADRLPVQRDLVARTFDLTAEPSSERAASAIMAALGAPPAGGN